MSNVDKKPETIRSMFNRISGSYDLLNRVLSGFVDQLWRRQLGKQLTGSKILDLATGTGDVLKTASHFRPHSQRTGIDFAGEMLRGVGKKDPEARLVQGDGRKLPFIEDWFDSISCAFGIRNMEPRNRVFGECYRILKPGGRLLILEFFPPSPGLFLSLYRFYLREVLPRVGRLISRTDAYSYLQQSVDEFCTANELERELDRAGFEIIENRALTGGIARLLVGQKPPSKSA